MKKLLFSCLSALILSAGEASAKMSAFFSYCAFNQPRGSAYIETYLTVIGSTVNFTTNSNHMLQSKIEVQWVLKKEDKIIAFDKYNLLSQELKNESESRPNFMDQQRIPISNGSYVLEVSIADKNSTDDKFTTTQKVEVNFPVEKVSISDIETLESYSRTVTETKISKNGYDLVPYLSDFYPESMESIKFYAEIYNTNILLGDDYYLVRYAIVNDNNKQVLNDLVAAKKMKSSEVSVLLAELPLGQVSSGNYTLNVEVRNKSNEMMAHKSIFFQRSQKRIVREVSPNEDFTLLDVNNSFVSEYTNKDSLRDYVACLYPISGKLDRQIAINQLERGDVKSMQQYLFYFWQRQDKEHPEKKWMEYKAEVNKVNEAFSTHNTKGYDTERGRVYLQYGPPNTIEKEENNTDSYPYEIWHYYQIANQTNKKFVFYSRSRGDNNYVLLHSDVTGEISAYDWQRKLEEKNVQNRNNIDDSQVPATYGNRIDDDFNNPH